MQLGALFILQVLSALSEAVSLGAIVPFLSVLTDVNALQNNTHIQTIMNTFGITDPKQLTMLLAGCFAGAVVIANMLRFVTLWFHARLAAIIGTDVATDMFRKTLYKPYSYFIQNNSSELIGAMAYDLNATLGIIQGILTFVSQILIVSVIIVSVLLYNPAVSVSLGLAITCAYALIIFSVRKKLHRNSAIRSDNYRGSVKTLQESFSGIGFIELSHSWKIFVDQYEKKDKAYRICAAENSVIKQAPKYFIESLGIVAISITAIVLTSNTENFSKVIPLLGFLGLAAHRLLPAGQLIYNSLSDTMGVRVSLDRTLDTLAAPLNKKNTKPVTNPIIIEKNIRFNDIWFDYNKLGKNNTSDKWTLRNLNFEIKAKTTVAFVGQTGSGKSTVADIILGLLTPQKGTITVDGTTLNETNIGNWQAAISFVPQTIFLTDSTIAQNIAFGVKDKEIDIKKVQEVARLAQIDDFIQTLPKKYDEMTGERGVRLSGGQLQRIGIARALYNNPSVIIFDEATSALDSNTEKEVMASIEQSCKDVTVILIAHRISTVKKADTIFVLENGRIVDQGNYDHLLSGQSYFKKLVNE